MGFCLWLLLAFMNEVTATFHPRQQSDCQVVQMEVHCSDMNLKIVPAQLPPDIRKLDLSRNLLQNLTWELSSFYSTIRYLNLHSNKIQFIQPGLFQGMTSLQVLDLSKNDLDIFAGTKTEIGPLTSVKELDLSGNGLYTGMTDYFLRDAPALLNLSLDGNSITKIDKETFSKSKALRNIDLHNNVILEIEEGAFESLPDLSELDLSMNSITCITDFNLFQLKLLNLSKNSMESFQTMDSDLNYELLYLDLRENKIHYFPILPRNNKLIYLDLARNRIRSVISPATTEELDFGRFPSHTRSGGKKHYNNLSRLLYLDMSYNQIKSIPVSFLNSTGSLMTLNLSNNCLETYSVDQDSPLNFLRTLDLSFNALQNLSFGENTLKSLEELYLMGNMLKTMDPQIFYRLPSIRNLHLQQNLINVCEFPHTLLQSSQHAQAGECVVFSYIPTLNYLYLSANNLESVPQFAFYGSPLHVLDLSHNPGLFIHKNAFSGLERSLNYLSLKDDSLHVLNTDLSLLSSLRYVDLSVNKLTALPLWNKESVIESLNLQNNSLVTLEYNTVLVLERTLKTLYLGSNPLSCCSNARFLHMVQKSVTIPDHMYVMCQYTHNSEPIEINIMRVEQEHCEKQDKKSVGIIIIIITALGLIVVFVVVSKLCHPWRHRPRGSFKA